MGWRVVTPGVPQSKIQYGATGTVEPIVFPYAAGPATAGPYVETPEAITGGNTQVIGAPGAVVHMSQAPFQPAGNCTPLESQPGAWGNPVVSNQRLITPPCNALTAPRIRPPKFIDPPIQGANTPASAAAAYARGGKPRGVHVPQPWVTGAPQVATRWSTYGASS